MKSLLSAWPWPYGNYYRTLCNIKGNKVKMNAKQAYKSKANEFSLQFAGQFYQGNEFSVFTRNIQCDKLITQTLTVLFTIRYPCTDDWNTH